MTRPIAGLGRGHAPGQSLYPISLAVGAATLTAYVPLSVAVAFGLGLIGAAHLIRWLSEPASGGPGLELLGARWAEDLDLLEAEEVPAAAVLIQPRRGSLELLGAARG